MNYLIVDIINKLIEPNNIDYKYIYAAINPQTNVLIVSGLFKSNIYFKSYMLNPLQINKTSLLNTDLYKTYLQIDLDNDKITSYTNFNMINLNMNYIYVTLYEYDKHLYPSQYAIDNELTKCCI
jgi:hypothetical protein